MSLSSSTPHEQNTTYQQPPSPSPAGISAQTTLPELPAPRKTSSPLSSPSSIARGINLPNINDDGDEDEDGMVPNDNHGEIRSPATSSTLPLTDEEDEDDVGGDEDSELTEEEDEEAPSVNDDEEDEDEVGGSIGKIRQPLFPTSKSTRADSPTSTASLTPPPSDKSILSSPQPSPKITLKLNAPKQQETQDHDNHDSKDSDASAIGEEGGDNDEEEGEEEEDEEDGDITMRADPSNEKDDEDTVENENEGKIGLISTPASQDKADRDANQEQGETTSAEAKDQKPIETSAEDPVPIEKEAEAGAGAEDQEEEEGGTLEEDKQMGDRIVIDEDEVDVEPPVEIGIEVEEPQPIEQEDLEGENDQPVDQEQEEEAEEEPEQEEEVDENEAEAADSPAYLTVPMHGKAGHSTHAPPPTSAAMRSLVMLELKFAALRDRLYIERMEEAAAEEEMILNGTHPALKFLYKTLSDRRERLHEVASRRHQQTLGELKRVREAEKHLIWSSWTEDRDRLHWNEFEQTWSKRRRLAREKNEMETPRTVKSVPKVGQPIPIRAFDWSAVATPGQLSSEDGNNDLALMEQQSRRQYQTTRNASPAMFASQYNIAGPSSQPVNGGTTIYTYPQTQQILESQPRQPAAASNHSQAQPQSIPQQQSQNQSQNPINPHTSYPPRIPTTSNPNPYQPSQPPSTTQMQTQNQVQPVQRREGRTVPTTSDFFNGGPRRDPITGLSSITGVAQKVKSPEEEPLSPIGLWSRGINGGNQAKKEGSSPRTPSSLGTPTISNTIPPGNQSSLGLSQNPTSSIGGVTNHRPSSAETASGVSTIKRSPLLTDEGRIRNGYGPVRSNSAGSAPPNTSGGAGGSTANQHQQPPRSNSNPTSSMTSSILNQGRDRDRDRDTVVSGQSSNPNPNPNPNGRDRPEIPSKFASLADYLASSTAPPGTGLFGMGIGMGMGMGMGMGGLGGMGGMGLGVPMGVSKNIGNIGQNKARSPFQNGNSSPASTTNPISGGLGASNNHNTNNAIHKSTSPIPPAPPPSTGTATIAGTNEGRS